jgi:hypothetical protein
VLFYTIQTHPKELILSKFRNFEDLTRLNEVEVKLARTKVEPK